jgi:hypothetical protein
MGRFIVQGRVPKKRWESAPFGTARRLLMEDVMSHEPPERLPRGVAIAGYLLALLLLGAMISSYPSHSCPRVLGVQVHP